MNNYYRITYKNEGIYDALKKQVGLEKWKELLLAKEMTWLPKPPMYSKNNKSYFTILGYEKFKKETLPLIYKYLDKDDIITKIYNDVSNICYADDYQVVSK